LNPSRPTQNLEYCADLLDVQCPVGSIQLAATRWKAPVPAVAA
jgi:hypothetical protein